jgi:hypothetical protein
MKEITLGLQATPTDEGFDILAISEGEAIGHGIKFSSDVLQQGMNLYASRPVFIDHPGFFEGPSVRNLAGTLESPTWNNLEKGIQLKLKPAGPAADVLLDVRAAAKTNPAIMEAIGFSTVLNVKLDKAGNVTKILRVKSVDVVVDPARGGKFLQSLEAIGDSDRRSPSRTRGITKLLKGVPMKKKVTPSEADEVLEELEETVSNQELAALQLQGASDRMKELEAKNEQATQFLLAQCSALLESSLAASKLPGASQKAVRKSFDAMIAKGEPFTVTALQDAINDKRAELAELNQHVEGPARQSNVFGMFTGKEQFNAALADLLGAPRDPGMDKLKVRPLSGIREAYILGTGDQFLNGGYYSEFALATASDFTKVTADLLNKILLGAWEDFKDVYGWWEKIVDVEHFNNLQDIKWLKTGTIGSLPVVAKGGEYQELAIGDNKETSVWYKYGGFIAIELEDIINDDVRAIKRLPKEAALGGIRNISEQVAAIFTQNSGAGPTLTDGGALFNSTAVTTAGGHANLLTTALGTDYTAWKAAANAMYKQALLVKNDTGYYGTGKKQAIRPRFCLVPIDLADQADALFIPRWEASAQNVATVSPTWGGRVEPLIVPDWTDATDWAAAADPKYCECVKIGEIFGLRPQIFTAGSDMDPAMFANDESRIKVRHFLNVGVADFRGLHKNNVA